MDVINAKSNTYPFVEVVIYSEILRTNCRMNQSSSHLAWQQQLYIDADVELLWRVCRSVWKDGIAQIDWSP